MAATTVASLLPKLGPPGQYGADKVVHIAVFAALAIIPALQSRTPVRGTIALVCVLLLGCASEFGQTFVPGRVFSLGDLAANAAGLLLGTVAGATLRARLALWENS